MQEGNEEPRQELLELREKMAEALQIVDRLIESTEE